MGCGFCTFGDPPKSTISKGRAIHNSQQHCIAMHLPHVLLSYLLILLPHQQKLSKNVRETKKLKTPQKGKQKKNNVLATTLIFGLVAKSLVVFIFLFFRGFAILVKNKKLEKTERRVLATTLICVLVAKSLFFLVFGGFGYFWSKTKKTRENKKTMF